MIATRTARVHGSITVEERTDVTVCRIHGAIDETLRDQASAAMSRLVARRLPIVLDTSGVTFMDSSGLAFLIVCSQAAPHEGERVRLPTPPSSVLQLLDVAGASHLFDVVGVAHRRTTPARPSADARRLPRARARSGPCAS